MILKFVFQSVNFFSEKTEDIIRKAHYASLNETLRRNILSLAEKCEEFHVGHGLFLDFIK